MYIKLPGDLGMSEKMKKHVTSVFELSHISCLWRIAINNPLESGQYVLYAMYIYTYVSQHAHKILRHIYPHISYGDCTFLQLRIGL